jgi:HlyD family secretion protein
MRLFKVFFIVVLALLAAAFVATAFRRAYQPQPQTVQGQIEAQQYAVSSKVPGRIAAVHVSKGDTVKQGQLVFTLESPELDAKMAQAAASREAAAAMAEAVEKGARRQQVAAAENQWRQAKAAADLAEKTFVRIDSLFRDGVMAAQKRDEAQAQFTAARHGAEAAYQAYTLAVEGARQEEKEAAAARVRIAEGAEREVRALAADTTIHSPHDGEVEQLLLQAGELAPQGFPVVTLVDMDDAWAVFHVREDLLRHFPKDAEITATVPALGDKEHSFRVTRVAAMGDFATWRATDAGKGYDMRSFEIEARPLAPIAGLRAGMSVLVRP